MSLFHWLQLNKLLCPRFREVLFLLSAKETTGRVIKPVSESNELQSFRFYLFVPGSPWYDCSWASRSSRPTRCGISGSKGTVMGHQKQPLDRNGSRHLRLQPNTPQSVREGHQTKTHSRTTGTTGSTRTTGETMLNVEIPPDGVVK